MKDLLFTAGKRGNGGERKGEISLSSATHKSRQVDWQAHGGTKPINSQGLALRDTTICGKSHPGQVIVSGKYKGWPTWESSSLPVRSRPILCPNPPYTYKPCPTPGMSSGPIVPLLHISQNTPTLRRRQRLLEVLSAQYSTVLPLTRSSIRAHSNSSVYPRFT